MKPTLANKAAAALYWKQQWEEAAGKYADKVIDKTFLQHENLSPNVVKGAIYAAYLSGALKATEECSRIMKK